VTNQEAVNWFYARGTLARDGFESVVDSAIEGWAHTGIRVAVLDAANAATASVTLDDDPVERIIVPLSGSFTVEYSVPGALEKRIQVLTGRASVFDGPTDVLYLPTGTMASITAAAGTTTGKVAVAQAPTSLAFPASYLPVREVPVELRGAGRSSRQVHNFGTPTVLAADRLIVCEVITPAENWSSYPPHKHDETIPGVEAQLEEIYYFETAVTKTATVAPAAAEPFGFMRTYASDARPIDILAEVHSGDIALVPHGWHGPCVAAPGYDLYYLNVMAGPGPQREWQITDDPAHAWVRDTWHSQEIDPRLPYTATPVRAAEPASTTTPKGSLS
jgi:5-deoxy-glucuronate isomerase